MKLIYDMDAFVYTAAFAAQTTVRRLFEKGSDLEVARFTSAKDRDIWLKSQGYQKRKEWLDIFTERTEVHPREGWRALEIFHHLVEDPIYRFQPETTVGFLSCPIEQNFRYKIYTSYKSSRNNMPKPIHFDIVRREAEAMCTITPGLEADDLCLIEATMSDEPWVIVAEDKDFFQQPGTYWNWKKNELKQVGELEAIRAFWGQVLTGDRVDDIPGIRGVGEVTARKLLEDATTHDNAKEIVLNKYIESGLDEREMNRNASLLYLLRHKEDTWTGATG